MLSEPTSGLDSLNALRTVQVLIDLARSGRTVIATIHQPSSKMFSLFDDLCLLSEGDILYLGPRKDSVQRFEDLNFECPKHSNPGQQQPEFFISSY